MGLGFCRLTMERMLYVSEARKQVPDRQGLPPETNERYGYAACFPNAPRICAQFSDRDQTKENQ